MKLEVIVPVMRDTDLIGVEIRINYPVTIINNKQHNKGVIQSYQLGYEKSSADILAFIHDDVTIDESDWQERVVKEFEDESVGVVGFGGAKNHGVDNIYKIPYDYKQLARADYMSNTDDAENHGTRFAGSCEVAVLDGFCLIVRRELLDSAGGWPVDRYPPHHNYDYWICCKAHQLGYKVRLVGVRCMHHGGLTATTGEYLKWCRSTKWGSDEEMHKQGHRLIYDDFRDVLPWRCL